MLKFLEVLFLDRPFKRIFRPLSFLGLSTFIKEHRSNFDVHFCHQNQYNLSLCVDPQTPSKKYNKTEKFVNQKFHQIFTNV